ncbi:hypothetical protein FRC12_009511 [Ceratobasidium sp. 428]|nr:hypothetical protein FRC12_009511 [Ceratobasidium sp. 428]
MPPSAQSDASRARARANPDLARIEITLTDEHKLFWNAYVGQPFQDHIGPRGKKMGTARGWTRDLFLTKFCDEFFPTLSAASRQDLEVLLGGRAYEYLTNHSARGRDGIKAKPPTAVKTRVYAHDVWAREESQAHKEAVRDYLAENPNDKAASIGDRRSITIKVFNKLPKEDQEKYRQKALESMKTLKGLQVLVGEERTDYAELFKQQLESMVKEGERCAGLRMNAQVLFEDTAGNFNITTFVSESMSDLEDSAELDGVIRWMKDWVKKSAARPDEVAITVYPDLNRDMFPLVPRPIGLKAADAQRITRLRFTMGWAFQGGHGKFPWEIVCANLDSWIEPHRRPTNAVLADPSTMRRSDCITWIQYFHDCQEGVIPPDNHFQLARVFAGPSPIDPSLSQESSRRLEYIPQQCRETWVLEFTHTVTRCHAPEGMSYPSACLEYGKFLKSGNATSTLTEPYSSVYTHIPGFYALPTGDSYPSALITGQEEALVTKYATELPDTSGPYVLELVEAINTHQSHLPASTPQGMWVAHFANSMPAVFPSAHALMPGVQLFINFYLCAGSYAPSAVAPLVARFLWFRMYVEEVLESKLIRHEISNTLIGGENGIVWLGRALILYIFNIEAANGHMKPPRELPAGYDATCLPIQELDTIIEWARKLIELLKASTEILVLTSEARKGHRPEHYPTKQDPVAVPRYSPAPIVDHSSPASLPADSPVPATTTKAARRKPRDPANKKKTADQDVEKAMTDVVSDVSAEDQNYDGLDLKSNGTDDLNPDGYSEGGDPAVHNATGQPGGHTRASEGLADLKDMCAEVFQTSRIEPDDSNHVFGAFLPLPRASPNPLPGSYTDVYEALGLTTTLVDETLRSWNAMTKSFTAERVQQIQAAQEMVSSIPAPFPPLVSFAAARRVTWECDKKFAPIAIDHLSRLALVARDALQLDATVIDFCGSGPASTLSGTERNNINKRHLRLQRSTIELCWTYKELIAFEKLATKWSNSLPLTWIDGGLPFFGEKLYSHVAPLADWADEALHLNTNLLAQRRKMWQVLRRPFEAKNKVPLQYWFGNPRPEEMPEDFKDCLKGAKQALDDVEENGRETSGDPANVASGISSGSGPSAAAKAPKKVAPIPTVAVPAAPAATVPAVPAVAVPAVAVPAVAVPAAPAAVAPAAPAAVAPAVTASAVVAVVASAPALTPPGTIPLADAAPSSTEPSNQAKETRAPVPPDNNAPVEKEAAGSAPADSLPPAPGTSNQGTRSAAKSNPPAKRKTRASLASAATAEASVSTRTRNKTDAGDKKNKSKKAKR